MSCKVLCDPGEQAPARITWKHLNSGRPTVSSDPGQSARGAISDDAVKLQLRLVELERTMESEVRKAQERGFEAGAKAGREAAAAEIQPALDRMLRSCSDVAGLRARIRRETEEDIVTLTIAIARRVLRRELSVDPDAIHGIVKAALEKVQTKEITLIRVHPEHLAHARAYLEKSGIMAGLSIEADPSLQPGGLVLETRRGNLDASVETQLKEIERGFTDRLVR